MKFSIILPTYKKKDVVLKQLERLYSYFEKNTEEFELIFVIDGIIDNTKDILTEYIAENKLKNIKVVAYKQNRGKGFAIRYGLKYASGDVIG